MVKPLEAAHENEGFIPTVTSPHGRHDPRTDPNLIRTEVPKDSGLIVFLRFRVLLRGSDSDYQSAWAAILGNSSGNQSNNKNNSTTNSSSSNSSNRNSSNRGNRR